MNGRNPQPGRYDHQARAQAQDATASKYLGAYVERDEWSVLSSVASEGPWMFNELVAAGVNAQTFADSRASFVWRCFTEHIRADIPVTWDAVVRSFDDLLEKARKRALTDEKFQPNYLHMTGEKLADIVFYTGDYRTDAETVKFIANRLVNRWRFKKAEREISSLLGEAATWDKSPEEFVAHAQAKILALPTAADTGGGVKNVAEILPAFLDKKYDQYTMGDPVTGLKTGYPKLDKLTKGMNPGNLIIITAGSGVGKTSLAINIAANVAKQGKRVLVFSLEMTDEEVLERLVWLTSQVNSSDYYGRTMTESHWEQVSRRISQMEAQNIDIVDDSGITMAGIHATAMRQAYAGGVDLIIVDYAQLLQTGESKRSDNREQEVRAIADGLKRLGGELRVPVIALSQMNDDGKLRESRTLYHHASHVWLLEKDACQDGIDPMNQSKRYLLKLQKGRNSSDDNAIRMLYFYSQTRLEEEADIEEFEQ